MAFKWGSWSSTCQTENDLRAHCQELINKAHLSSTTVFWCYLEDLLQLFVILHHNNIGLAVVCYVLTGFGAVGGVDAHSEPTATEHRVKSSNSPFPLNFYSHSGNRKCMVKSAEQWELVSNSHVLHTASFFFLIDLKMSFTSPLCFHHIAGLCGNYGMDFKSFILKGRRKNSYNFGLDLEEGVCEL